MCENPGLFSTSLTRDFSSASPTKVFLGVHCPLSFCHLYQVLLLLSSSSFFILSQSVSLCFPQGDSIDV